MKLAITYTLFALIAAGANIAIQDLVVQLYQGVYYIYLSIAIGTGFGLIIKYVLDKEFIFKYRSDNLLQNGQKFLLYSLMGLGTTVVFWGFELGFHFVFQSKSMRYLGAIIGLAIGYYTKYQLDKRYVFTKFKN